ncbi:MAG: NAD(P)H-binding protein [Actinomycetota bacterium]|nr:NAD(P)H-binding protein [Actinomycetota bacterium]
MRVLVTGGTGKLGRALLPKLAQAGHDVVALSRRPLAEDIPADNVRGDLSTGEGLDDAVRSCDVVVHAATGGFGDRYSLRWAIFHQSAVDVGGTRNLLNAAERARVSHFLFTSIVGIDRVPVLPAIYRYFKHKLIAEKLVLASSLPSTTVRLTQFHPLVNQTLEWQSRKPSPMFTPETAGQPIDPSDAADVVISCIGQETAHDVLEFGGPEVLTGREIVEAWCAQRGIQRKPRFFRPPGEMGRAMAEGALTCPHNVAGHITWGDWLSLHPLAANSEKAT